MHAEICLNSQKREDSTHQKGSWYRVMCCHTCANQDVVIECLCPAKFSLMKLTSAHFLL